MTTTEHEESPYTNPTDQDLYMKGWNYYRMCKPKAFREMDRDGTLPEVIIKRVRACKRYAENLIQNGMWDGEAWQQAIRQEMLGSESD